MYLCSDFAYLLLAFLQSQMQVMAAELVARAGEVDRLKTDLEMTQAESQNLRSEVAALRKTSEETQKRLDSEVSLACLPVLSQVCLLR